MDKQDWQTLAQNRAVTINEMAVELAELRQKNAALSQENNNLILALVDVVDQYMTKNAYGKFGSVRIVTIDTIRKLIHY